MSNILNIKKTSKALSLIFFFLLNTYNTKAQSFEWANSFGGNNNEIATSSIIDNNGNVYTTGVFSDTVDFDPSINTFNLISNAEKDIFIQKLDAAGNFVWAIAISGDSSYCYANTQIDEYGNLYITGNFAGEFDFDPGPSTHNINSNGKVYTFILKLDSLTNFIWVKTIGGDSINDNCHGYNIYIQDTTLIVSGRFKGNIDFDPDPLITNTLTPYNNYDVFILKLDTNGNLSWVKVLQTSYYANTISIGMDTSNNVYIAGTYRLVVDFDPGVSSTNLCSQNGYDSYILKLDADGNFVWVKTINGSSNVNLSQMLVDPTGYIYSVGQFFETIDLDPSLTTNYFTSGSATDIFIQKLDFSGNLIWAKSYGGLGFEGYAKIALDNNSNLYTFGRFYDSIDINPSNSVFILNSFNEYYDFYIQKLDVSGNFLWAVNYGGLSNIFTASILVNSTGYLYTSGYYYDAIDCDPGNGVHNIYSNGGHDFFILKLRDCFSTRTDSVFSCNSYTWIDGNTYTSSNNSAMHTIPGTNGCDTIVSLNLEITTINTTLSVSGINIVSHASNSSFQWVDCDNNYSPIFGETNPNFTPTSNGRYAVVIYKNGCIDTSQCVEINTISIDENILQDLITVYPNPSNEIVNIDFAELRNCNVKVLNAYGQTVHEKKNIENNCYQFNISKTGIYFIEVSYENKKAFFKLIIE